MYAVRHIIRHKVKTLLIFATTLFFVIALGLLQETITRTESEIDYLYATTVVSAEVRRSDGSRLATPERTSSLTGRISPQIVYELLNTEFIQNEFLQSIHLSAFVTPATDNGELNDDWLSYFLIEDSYIENRAIFEYISANNQLIAVNELGLYHNHRLAMMNNPISLEATGAALTFWNPETREFDLDAILQARYDLRIELSDGFGEYEFVFEHGRLSPIVISEYTAVSRGLSIGDMVFVSAGERDPFLPALGHVFFDDLDYFLSLYMHFPAIIAGLHSGAYAYGQNFRDAVIIPLGFLDYIISHMRIMSMGFRTMAFEIDPVWNRELDFVQETLQPIVTRSRWYSAEDLRIVFYDAELRVVVGSMEQNLSLLRLLYPIAIAVSVIIGAGLSILLMLQNAKNAAIMRVLGSVKKQTRVALWIEQLIVCLAGIVIGLAAVFILGWGASASVMLAGLYLAGAVIGSVVGSVLVTSKPPLELLQVRE